MVDSTELEQEGVNPCEEASEIRRHAGLAADRLGQDGANSLTEPVQPRLRLTLVERLPGAAGEMRAPELPRVVVHQPLERPFETGTVEGSEGHRLPAQAPAQIHAHERRRPQQGRNRLSRYAGVEVVEHRKAKQILMDLDQIPLHTRDLLPTAVADQARRSQLRVGFEVGRPGRRRAHERHPRIDGRDVGDRGGDERQPARRL